jgi:hypothetical protein
MSRELRDSWKIIDPRKTAQVESSAGTCDGNVGEAGVRFAHGFRDRATTVVVLAAVWGPGGVISA